MTKSDKIIEGRKEICAFLEIGVKRFYTLKRLGLPATRKGGRLTGHTDELEAFYKNHGGDEDKGV